MQDRSSRCIFYNTDKSKVQEIPQLQMRRNPVRVSLSLLQTRPSTSDIYKINEGPYCLLRRLNIFLIIYLDDMLILARSVHELIFHRDTVIYLLPNLVFVLHLKRLVLEPSQKIEVLEMVLGSIKMEISLPQEKLVKLISQCKQVAGSKMITIIDLTKIIRKLGSTA